MANAELDIRGYEEIFDALRAFQGDAEKTINEILHGYGVELATQEITKLLPESGRTWKGKRKAAKQANPFTYRASNLAFEIVSRRPYGYLYFPDDGDNTTSHRGNQNFMGRGLENSIDSILDRVLVEVTDW